MTYCSFR